MKNSIDLAMVATTQAEHLSTPQAYLSMKKVFPDLYAQGITTLDASDTKLEPDALAINYSSGVINASLK